MRLLEMKFDRGSRASVRSSPRFLHWLAQQSSRNPGTAKQPTNGSPPCTNSSQARILSHPVPRTNLWNGLLEKYDDPIIWRRAGAHRVGRLCSAQRRQYELWSGRNGNGRPVPKGVYRIIDTREIWVGGLRHVLWGVQHRIAVFIMLDATQTPRTAPMESLNDDTLL